MLEKMNLLGAEVAVAFFISAILVFISRLLGKPQAGLLDRLFRVSAGNPAADLIGDSPTPG